jgi:hypothetical protein
MGVAIESQAKPRSAKAARLHRALECRAERQSLPAN